MTELQQTFDLSEDYYSDMITAYGKDLTEDRMHELYYMTDREFEKVVFNDASPSEFRSPIQVFTKKELNFILDYSEYISGNNRDWIVNNILDDYFE
tara:strand:- start:349 stop:636 length:288 start_codon:yes stop_codon:yes gene_type:complete